MFEAAPQPLLDRVEPHFARTNGTSDSNADALFFGDAAWSTKSATGIAINQQTAMQVAAVMDCVTILAEDVAKLDPRLWTPKDGTGARKQLYADDHPVAQLFEEPNDWQTWIEFASQMQMGLVLRGNAYAVIVRNGRGDPLFMVPINPDHVSLWESAAGELFYQVTRVGLHQLALLRSEPLLIPAENILHIKGLSSNGLLGFSRISLGGEAIALAAGQEQQAARWMGQGARPSGVLTTDKSLTDDAAKRMAKNWADAHGSLLKTGKTAVLEQGLKWQPISLSSADLQFLAQRQFQIEEIARLFRVPPYMLGVTIKSTGSSIVQQGQEYVNYTISTYTKLWRARLKKTFGLRSQGLSVDFDMSILLEGDILTRYQANRLKLAGWGAVNEVRIAEGDNPLPSKRAWEVFRPVNMAPLDSDIFLGSESPPSDKDLGSDLGGDNPGAGAPTPDALNSDQSPEAGMEP